MTILVRPWRRYALSVQYHGGSFLGFSYQGDQEDCILPDGTDLRGYRSVEGRLRQALQSLCTFDNLQVSSRTDRGVHALKNTLHVDIQSDEPWDLYKLHRGLNYHLARQSTMSQHYNNDSKRSRKRQNYASNVLVENRLIRYSPMNELRVLKCKIPPPTMANPWYESNNNNSEPKDVQWNARYSATQRTYTYRILNSDLDWAAPFEWDRAWRIQGSYLEVMSMRQAAQHLLGTHDFTSFRGASCQRLSPIVTLHDIHIQSQPYGAPIVGTSVSNNGLLGLGSGDSSCSQLVTITLVGNSFVYRQVRNLVGCLAAVGRGKLTPDKVRDILESRDRSQAPAMAPAHGLYLVDVQHGDFSI